MTRRRTRSMILWATLFVPLVCFCQNQAGNVKETGRFGSFTEAKAVSVSTEGKLAVVDAGAGEVFVLDEEGKIEKSLNGRGWGQLEFDQPADVDASPTLRLYVADYGNARIQVFDNRLNYVSTIDGQIAGDNTDVQFRYPMSVAVSRHNDVFVLDGDNARILKFDVSGNFQTAFGGFDAGRGRLLRPSRLRISTRDILGVADGHDILFFDLFGNYLTRYEGDTAAGGFAPFPSDPRWIIGSDSTLTVIEPELSGCRILGSLQYVNEADLSQRLPPIRDIAMREGILYLLTDRAIVKATVDAPK